MKKVAIYTTPTCTHCKQTKEFFKNNNVQYEEYDVSSDEAKKEEMVEKSGQLGVPVITIDDETIVGFDEAKLKGSLGL